jgi:hypothetical protein
VTNNLARFRHWLKRLGDVVAGRKRTEITIETDRVLIIGKRHSIRACCQECGCEVDMVTQADAAALSQDAQILGPKPMLPGYGEGRGWHWSQAVDGTALICLESVLRSK